MQQTPTRRSAESTMRIVAFVIGGLMFVVGLLIMMGVLGGNGAMADPTLRSVFGLVLMLYGTYRLVIANTQRRRAGDRTGSNNGD